MTLFGRTSPSDAEAERAHRRRWMLIPGVVVLLCVVVGLVTALGPFRTKEQTISQEYPSGITKIQVESPGELSIVGGGPVDQARAMWETHWNYRKPAVRATRDGDTLRLRLDCSTSVGVECFADLRMLVPSGVDVDVMSSGGDVNMARLDGNVGVDNKGGDVNLEDIGGDVDIVNKSGDVQLRDVGGNVTAETKSGEIEARGLTGKTARLSGNSGDIRADFDSAPEHVTADTKSGDIEIGVPRGSGPYQVRSDVKSGDLNTEVSTSSTATPVIDVSVKSGSARIAYSDHGSDHDSDHGGPRRPPEPPAPRDPADPPN